MLAIVTTYAARGLRVVFPCLLALNTLMIVSTVPYGGHYLVDVLAGGVIALLAIVGVRAIGGTPAT
jgi:membrane-associated phospholipid phosphatase